MSRKNRHRNQPKPSPSPSNASPSPTADSSAKTKPMVRAMELFRTQDAASKAILRNAQMAIENGIAASVEDSYDNFISRVGLDNDNPLSAGTYEFDLVTRNRVKLEQAYRGSWIVGQVVDTVAEDMTRAGVTFETTEGVDDDIKTLQSTISRLQVWQSLAALIKWGRLYGGALAVMQIAGQALDTPLDEDTIGEGQFLGLVVYDRWQLNPVLTPVIGSGPEMGLPMFYQITNNQTGNAPEGAPATGLQKIHHSRCIRFTGIDLPYFQAITEMMWGESVLERLWDRLIAFDNATMSTGQLVDRANLRTVGIEGLREIIAAGDEAMKGLEGHFEMMRLAQVNEGLTLLDKNDTFDSTAYTFTGLDLVLLQFAQQLSGATGIPLVRLFSQSPSGLNSTGDSDIRMYYDNINSWQESKLRNGWQLLSSVMWRSQFGKPAPKDLEFSFTSLWQMSATDKANNAKTTTETILGAFTADLTKRGTALKELKTTSGDTGLFSSITDEEIAEADEEADNPPMPDMPDPANSSASPDPTSGVGKTVKNLDRKNAWQALKDWWNGTPTASAGVPSTP